jgi:hypothetical protein
MFVLLLESKKIYQPRINIIEDEEGDFVTDSHNIFAKWRTSSQLFNVHGVNVVRQTETQTAQPLAPESSAFELGLLKS